jgi:hypothetical protein
MTKKYCDKCGDEIKPMTQCGVLVRFVKAMGLDPHTKLPRTFFNEDAGDYCEKCIDKMIKGLDAK